MKSKFVLAAGLVTLAATLMPAVNAAQDAGPAQAGGSQAGGSQAQVRPHSHVQEKVGIAPAAQPKAPPKAQRAKPLHDHGKFHKQL